MDEALGRSLLPGFRIAGPLPGSGVGVGMSERLLARHDALGLAAAVEVFPPVEGGGSEGLERLLTAAPPLGALTHRTLAGLLLAGCTEDGRCFLMTEWSGESTLAQELRDVGPEPLLLPRALSLLAQLAAGLQDAHDAGVVHRDLRPEHVAFGPAKPDDVVLQLRGVGRAALLEAVGLLPDGDALLVDPAYASPEQLAGDAGGAPADVYALGVLAYRLCTGRLPFECASRELYKAAHRDSAPHSPGDRRPSYVAPLPQEVDALILACLKKDPRARPAPRSLTKILAEAALASAKQAREQQRESGPLGVWKRLRAKAVETARYLQFVQLDSEPLTQALAAFRPHDKTQHERFGEAEAAVARWDVVHGELRGREHRLRHAVLALGLDRGRLVAHGAGDQPGAMDLARQIDELLRSVATAQAQDAVALRAATAELTRSREAAEGWGRREPNRVMELVEAIGGIREASGNPSVHQRIDDLMDLAKLARGGSVPTLPGP